MTEVLNRDEINQLLDAFNAGETEIEIAKVLVSEGADVNARTNIGKTPLHIAAYYGKIEVAKVLISGEADVNVKDNEGQTPFYLAVDSKHIEIAKLLISEGADVNASYSFSDATAPYGIIGDCYYDLGDYQKALEYHLEALESRKKLSKKGDIALACKKIAMNYEVLGDKEKALEYYKQAFSIYYWLEGQEAEADKVRQSMEKLVNDADSENKETEVGKPPPEPEIISQGEVEQLQTAINRKIGGGG